MTAEEKGVAETVIRVVARRWTRKARWVDPDDLRQEAWLAALDGLRRARPGTDAAMLHAFLRLRVNGALSAFVARAQRHTPVEAVREPVAGAPSPEAVAVASVELTEVLVHVERALLRMRKESSRRTIVRALSENMDACGRRRSVLRLRRLMAQDLQAQRLCEELEEMRR